MDAQIVVVTGASGGIGRAVAKAFGAAVALLARGEQGLAGAADDVRAGGGTALVVPIDVANAEAVHTAVDRIETQLGPIAVKPSLRTAPREEQCARHDGANAGSQHTAILLGTGQAAQPSPARTADLPT